MTQTEKSEAAIEALLIDNAVGAISPQDLRDAFASGMGYAGMILSIAGAPASMIGVGTSYSLVDVCSLVTSQSIDVNLLGSTATLSPTYSLTPGATGIYHVEFWASFSTSANNHLVTFAPHVNGSIGLVEVDRWIGTNTDTGVVSMGAIIPYTVADVIDMRVKVDSGSIDLTFLAAGFNFFRVG